MCLTQHMPYANTTTKKTISKEISSKKSKKWIFWGLFFGAFMNSNISKKTKKYSEQHAFRGESTLILLPRFQRGKTKKKTKKEILFVSSPPFFLGGVFFLSIQQKSKSKKNIKDFSVYFLSLSNVSFIFIFLYHHLLSGVRISGG